MTAPDTTPPDTTPPDTTPPDNKDEWRRRARANSQGLRIDHVRIREGVARFVERAKLEREEPPAWVVAYWPLRSEPDLRPLWAGADSTCYALTRTPSAGHMLTVHPASSPTEEHRYGFRQPVADAPIVRDDHIAIVLVPGLAFDLFGTRLGHGAGYYDRFLARLPDSVLRIGVCSGYLVNDLPRDAHDVPMTHLATEIGVIPIRPRP
ncbi:MAG: 5-formyltetrahydrofolate cyclo-ligase [Actinomycetota bacterium]|nr:5-formyltetrahydrofolate cyclo-ligase [Actinomycetota bacterium]